MMPQAVRTPTARDGVGHIVIVTPDIVGPIKNGGIGTACFHYARTLADAQHKVEVLFCAEIGAEQTRRWSEWYSQRGIDLFTLDHVPKHTLPVCGCRWYTERAEQVMRFLRQRSCDYILFQDWHANGFWTTRARRMGAAFERTRIGVITHSTTQWQKEGMHFFGYNPVEESGLEWAEREQIGGADILISPSNHMVSWLREHGYTLPTRVEICPYTFEDPVRAGRPEALDRDHLIFFGRLETRKGLHLLGGALRNLKRTGVRLPRKVSFLGKFLDVEGVPTPDYLNALRTELETVEFRIETDFDYMQAIDYIRAVNGIVVIPSILDNYPLTVIESIANGFCFLASQAGGIPEMIDAAVSFPATVEGLRNKLAEVGQIDFTRLHHPYDPVPARTTWLAHVSRVVEEVRAAPRPAQISREEIPKISVCMPFHHHDRTVGRAIGSFLRMDLPGLQFVIVDDGTPSTERENFDRLAKELTPLGHIFQSQPDGSPETARNHAAKLAAHDLLLFFEPDNVPFLDCVERLWQAMREVDADSLTAPSIGVPPMARRPVLEDAVLRHQPQGGPVSIALLDNVLGFSCTLVRREVFDRVGGFPRQPGAWEDWQFFLRVIAAGLRHFVYPEPLFYHSVYGHRGDPGDRDYENRLGMLGCLDQMPARNLSETARAFAIETLVRRHARQNSAPRSNERHFPKR